MEGTGRRGRRRKQIMDNLKKTTGYWKLKEALDRKRCRTRYGSGYGPAIGWPWNERILQM